MRDRQTKRRRRRKVIGGINCELVGGDTTEATAPAAPVNNLFAPLFSRALQFFEINRSKGVEVRFPE
jgi:hypothetical protein